MRDRPPYAPPRPALGRAGAPGDLRAFPPRRCADLSAGKAVEGEGSAGGAGGDGADTADVTKSRADVGRLDLDPKYVVSILSVLLDADPTILVSDDAASCTPLHVLARGPTLEAKRLPRSDDGTERDAHAVHAHMHTAPTRAGPQRSRQEIEEQKKKQARHRDVLQFSTAFVQALLALGVAEQGGT